MSRGWHLSNWCHCPARCRSRGCCTRLSGLCFCLLCSVCLRSRMRFLVRETSTLSLRPLSLLPILGRCVGRCVLSRHGRWRCCWWRVPSLPSHRCLRHTRCRALCPLPGHWRVGDLTCYRSHTARCCACTNHRRATACHRCVGDLGSTCHWSHTTSRLFASSLSHDTRACRLFACSLGTSIWGPKLVCPLLSLGWGSTKSRSATFARHYWPSA
mmetsp:Transcript_2290/g.3932  ORF Transcript_2290/g.3932 Transcript_2290/m.3932 type:complete len:213 (-) Transcript_2290:669-1307(-)